MIKIVKGDITTLEVDAIVNAQLPLNRIPLHLDWHLRLPDRSRSRNRKIQPTATGSNGMVFTDSESRTYGL